MALAEVFIEAAQELEAPRGGGDHRRLRLHGAVPAEGRGLVGIPFGLPSLLQIPMIHALCGGMVSIMTADSRRLTDRHLAAWQVREDIPRVICGMEGCDEFRTAILKEKGTPDSAAIEAKVPDVAARMQAETPDLRAILRECSDLPPHATAIQDRTELPVHDFNTLIRYLRDAVRHRSYGGYL